MAKIQKQLISIPKDGFSLIEILIAMGVFVLSVSAISFIILDAYIAERAGRERTQAVFLAEQGLEQARLIRDNDWFSLVSTGPEIIDNKFTRTMTVEDLDSDTKRITSQISWNLTETRSQDVSLITYLTNWQTTLLDCDTVCQNNGYSKGSCKKPESCRDIPLGGLGEYGCTVDKLCCCK